MAILLVTKIKMKRGNFIEEIEQDPSLRKRGKSGYVRIRFAEAIRVSKLRRVLLINF